MNDVIMASIAAAKARSGQSGFSLYTGFRSVRSERSNPCDASISKKVVPTTVDEQPCISKPRATAGLDTDHARSVVMSALALDTNQPET